MDEKLYELFVEYESGKKLRTIVNFEELILILNESQQKLSIYLRKVGEDSG